MTADCRELHEAVTSHTEASADTIGETGCQANGGLTRQLYEESNTVLEYINVPVLRVVTHLVWLTRNHFFY
jgi:hypothetical protein